MFRRVLLPAFLLLGGLLATPRWALPETILFYYSSADAFSQIALKMRDRLTTAGHTVTTVDVGASLICPSETWENFNQVWDVRYLNNNSFFCTSPPTTNFDYFAPCWQTKAQAYLENGGRLFLQAENSGFVSRNDGIYDFLRAIGALDPGFTDCTGADGNDVGPGSTTYCCTTLPGLLEYHTDFTGGVPLSRFNGTDFLTVSSGWTNANVPRSVLTGWTASQMAGLGVPVEQRGRLFVSWDISMWLFSQYENLPEKRAMTDSYPSAVADWLSGGSPALSKSANPTTRNVGETVTFTLAVSSGGDQGTAEAFQETFTGADGTLPAGWTEVAPAPWSMWEIRNNELWNNPSPCPPPGPDSFPKLIRDTPSLTDGTFQTDVYLPSCQALEDIVFVFKFVDDLNMLHLRMDWQGGGPAMYVDRILGGSFSTVASAGISFNRDTWYRLKIWVCGTNIRAKFWLRGNAEPAAWNINYTESTFPLSTPARVGYQANQGQIRYDNLQVQGVQGHENATVTDTVPAGIRYVADSCGAFFSGGMIVWNAGNLGPCAAAVTCRWWGTADGSVVGPIPNAAFANSDAEPVPGAASATVTVSGPTATPTPTFTSTPALTPTPTPTPSSTSTPSPTASPTPTPTPLFLRVWPNPFNPGRAVRGTLKFAVLPPGADVEIYTVSGELVFKGSEAGGRVEWNGLNEGGRPVASGTYYFVVRDGDTVVLKDKFLVLRR